MLVFILSSIVGVIIYAYSISGSKINSIENITISDALPKMTPVRIFLFVIFILMTILFILYGRLIIPGNALYTAYILISASDVIQIILGIIFGFVLGNWLHLLIDSNLLRKKNIYIAHKRWGYSLIVLLVIGITFPSFNKMISRITALSTPIGELAIQSEEKPLDPAEISTRAAEDLRSDTRQTYIYRQSKSMDLLLRLVDHKARDLEELGEESMKGRPGTISGDRFTASALDSSEKTKIFLKENEHKFADTNQLIYDVFAPFAACVDLILNGLQDSRHVENILASVIQDVRDILRYNKMSDDSTIWTSFAKSLQDKHADMKKTIDTYELENLASELGRCIKKSEHTYFRTGKEAIHPDTPYLTLVLAYFLHASGRTESAAQEIFYWLNTNKPDDMPKWYEIKMKSIAAILLVDIGRLHNALDIYNEIHDELESELKYTDMISLEQWQERCHTSSEETIHLMLVYTTTLNNMVYYSTALNKIDINLVRYAELLRDTDMGCFSRFLRGHTNYWRALFLHTYGVATLQFSQKVEAIDDDDRMHQKRMLRHSRNALEEAAELINPYKIQENASSQGKRYPQRLLASHDANVFAERIRKNLLLAKYILSASP